MKISIFTDASTNSTMNVSGFAFYIGCSKGKMHKAGILKTDSNNICIAELHCIANAIYALRAFKHKIPGAVTQIYIYSDRMDCVKAINGDLRYGGNETQEVCSEIHMLMYEFCQSEGIPIRKAKTLFKAVHVPAHTEKMDRVSVINDWCDKNARMYMKRAANTKTQKKKK